MTTIRQLIQSSPARANELFAKLVDTSENAVKTRERLFAELKEELELLASLEEQHIFPVLRKHKDFKELVRDALNDNRTTRKMLTELDHTPKDSEEFASRVAELRRVFQQHVRDEKKELLPAILKALSDEEAQAVVERIEAEKAEIDEAKRLEAEQRRAEAREERESAERVQHAAEAVVSTAWAAPLAAQGMARASEQVVRSGVGTASEVAQGATDQVARVADLAGQRTQMLAESTAQNLRVLTQSGSVMVETLQEISSECLDMAQERLRRNLEGVQALARCGTPFEFVAAQNALVRQNLELTMANGRRLAELSARAVQQATGPLAARADSGEARRRA
jgi:hypothetical protein